MPQFYKKVIFCGEKDLSVRCLNYLKKNFKVNIIGICTRKKSKVWWGKQVLRDYAKKNNIKILKTKNIKNNQADLLISVLFPLVIKKNTLDKFKLCINLHQAPLPEYKGCNGASHAIIDNAKYFGSTLHLLSKKLDSGDIIDKKNFLINKNFTSKELYEYNDEIAFKLFKKNIGKILQNKFNLKKQKKNFYKTNSRDSLKNKEIKLNMPKSLIWKKVRGNEFFPFEPCYINYRKNKIYLLTKPWKYNINPKRNNQKPWEFND